MPRIDCTRGGGAGTNVGRLAKVENRTSAHHIPTDGRADFLSDDHGAELHRLLRFYYREAQRCENAKAYLAGSVMAGAALEAALMLMVNAFPDDAVATGKIPKRKSVPKPLLKWDLRELLAVSQAAGWLPAGLAHGQEWKPSKAKVGDRVGVVRLIRNLLHPGRYLHEHYQKRITKKYLQFSLNAFSEGTDWLLARIERSISERIAAGSG